MKYMGSKRRIAKHILPIILKDRKPGQWYVETMVGGANLIDKVEGPRIGFDINKYLIACLREIRDGWVPFDSISKEQYKSIKDNHKTVEPFLVGYVGFELSFGSKFMGGYAGGMDRGKDRVIQGKNNVLKQAPLLKDCILNYSEYDKIKFKSPSIIYCDPPYKGTTKYKDGDFDHDKFWQWCRDRSAEGHQIFISEYQAPDDFKCIWQKEQTTTTAANSNYKKAIEKLFIWAA